MPSYYYLAKQLVLTSMTTMIEKTNKPQIIRRKIRQKGSGGGNLKNYLIIFFLYVFLSNLEINYSSKIFSRILKGIERNSISAVCLSTVFIKRDRVLLPK